MFSLFNKRSSNNQDRDLSSSANHNSDLKTMIQDTISNHDVVIYSKTYCPYCRSVKSLFSGNFPHVKTSVVELDVVANGSSIQEALHQITGQRTVPNVFVRGKHVGGNDDSQHAFKTGRLSELLQK